MHAEAPAIIGHLLQLSVLQPQPGTLILLLAVLRLSVRLLRDLTNGHIHPLKMHNHTIVCTTTHKGSVAARLCVHTTYNI